MRHLLVFLLLSSAAWCWPKISTNALGIRYDPSIATPTNGYAIVYDGALNAYKNALSGGSPTDLPWGGTAFSGSTGVQKMAIPLYIYPDANWTTVDGLSPKVGMIVANDSNGAFVSADPNYVAAINAAKTAGISVLGYVHTSYGAQPIGTVKNQIDNWYTYYGPDGIFLDEVSSSPADLPYYTTLYNYIRAKTGAAEVVLNPGTTTDEGYAAISDIICTFEGTYASYLSYVPSSWTRKYNATKFWHLVYSTTLANYPNALTLTKRNGAGWVNITDVAGYTALSSYIAQEAKQVGYRAGDAKITVSEMDSTGVTVNYVPLADGAGGVAWGAQSGGGGGAPSGPAGGDLTGTYPNPTVAALAITDAKVAAANKDGLAATPSMRTLGTGATQAMAGNQAPTAHAASHLPGGSDALTTATAVSVGASNSTGSAASFARSDHGHTIGAGIVTDTMVAAANKDGLAAVASMRTLGTGATQAAGGTDSRLSDSRAPNGSATGDLAGSFPSPTVAQSSTAFALNGVITPAQITANTDDYNPTGLSTASQLRLSTDASRNITGLQGGANGRIVTIFNVGSFDMVLVSGSLSSAAANRFGFGTGQDLTLGPAQATILQYDSTVSKWRQLGATRLVVATTSSFVIPAIGSTVSVAITSGAGVATNAGVMITDGAGGHSMIGGVTSGGGTLSLTVLNLGVLVGAVGNTMASGAIVSPGPIPYAALGTNNQVLTSNGTIGVYAANAAARFRLTLMPGAAEITGASSDPLLVGTKGTNSSWSYLAYNDTTLMQGRWVVGGAAVNDYAGGAITLRIRWYATATTGNVVWTVKTLSRAAGTVMDTAYDATNAHTVTTAPAGTTLQLVNSDITWTPIAGELTAGSLYMIQVERTASSGSDTMVGDANVVSATVTEN